MMIGRFSGLLAAVFIALFLHSARAQMAPTIDGDDAYSNPSAYNYGRFTPSMAILLVIFIVVVFLMGFFAVYIRHCSAAARGTIGHIGIGRNRTSALQGLDPAILTTFPTFSYSEVKSHKIGKNALECAVCLTEFDDEETLRLLPKCDHVFHADCIDLWLASHSTCPVCRANLEELPEASGRVVVSLSEPPTVESVTEIGLTIDEPESIDLSKSSNRARMIKSKAKAFGSFSKFPRSHTTGHCLVQPGENVDRFTLKLPSEIRNQIMNRTLNRSTSVVVLPTENSLRKVYRTGGDEVSNRGSMDQITEDRWWWSGLFIRNGSSNKPVLNNNNGGNGEGTSRFMGMVKQMSVRGSRKDRSGSVKDDKSTRPSV